MKSVLCHTKLRLSTVARLRPELCRAIFTDFILLMEAKIGAPDRSRTGDPLLRRLTSKFRCALEIPLLHKEKAYFSASLFT
ncbi:MAG TPA: hypothetical protein VJ873_12425, partial [bacterium]|nr:hypothetical protein [bacterium]